MKSKLCCCIFIIFATTSAYAEKSKINPILLTVLAKYIKVGKEQPLHSIYRKYENLLKQKYKRDLQIKRRLKRELNKTTAERDYYKKKINNLLLEMENYSQ